MSLVLSTILKGTPDQPRYILANQSKNFWTGKGWTEDENDALLFHDETEIGQLSDTLHRIENLDRPVTKFVAPVEVEVFGDVDFDKVQKWLMNASRLYVAGGQDAILSIDWNQLKVKS